MTGGELRGTSLMMVTSVLSNSSPLPLAFHGPSMGLILTFHKLSIGAAAGRICALEEAGRVQP